MPDMAFTLEPIDRDNLYHQLLTFATIQSARDNLERNGVDSPLRDIKLNAAYAADLHSIQLLVPMTGAKLKAVIDFVHIKKDGFYRVGVYIHGNMSKLKSKGIDCSEFGFAIGKRRKVKLFYQFNWYNGSDPITEGLFTLDSIN